MEWEPDPSRGVEDLEDRIDDLRETVEDLTRENADLRRLCEQPLRQPLIPIPSTHARALVICRWCGIGHDVSVDGAFSHAPDCAVLRRDELLGRT